MTWTTVARWKYDATSGTTVADSSGVGTAVNLTTSGTWTSVAAGKGLLGESSVTGIGTGNKVYAALQGSNACAIEIVYKPGAVADGYNFATRITDASNVQSMTLVVLSDGGVQVYMQHQGGGGAAIVLPAGSVTTSAVNVFTLIYDVLNGTTADRLRLIVNAARPTPGTYNAPTGTLNLGTSGQVDFRLASADDTFDGTTYWCEVSSTAPTDAEAFARHTNLLADNDADPGTVVGPGNPALSPANGATRCTRAGVTYTATFTENIALNSSKNVYLKLKSDDSTVETIDLADTGKVTVASNVLSITPATTLAYGIQYYWAFDANPLRSTVDSEDWPGITSSTGWVVTAREQIELVAIGTAVFTAANPSAVAPSWPTATGADIGLTGNDYDVAVVGEKPGAANSGSITAPSSPWAAAASLTAAGGYSTTLGADTGNCNLWSYYRASDGTKTGTLSITISSGGAQGVAWGVILRYNIEGSGTLVTPATTTGSQTTGGNVSVAGGADPGVAADDRLLFAMCIPTDINFPKFSAEAFSQTGVTWATAGELVDAASGNGNDIGALAFDAVARSGTSSAAPTASATAGGTTTNVRGPGLFIRLRASSSTPVVATFLAACEALRGGAGTRQPSVEAITARAATPALRIETAAAVISTRQANLEGTTGLSSPRVLLVEAAGGHSAMGAALVEGLAMRAAPSSPALEWAVALTSVRAASLESLLAALSLRGLLVEVLSGRSAAPVMLLEARAQGTVVAVAAVNIEALSAPGATKPASLESLAAAVAPRLHPLETLLVVASPRAAPVEWHSGVVATRPWLVEALAAIASGKVTQIESSAQGNVTALALMRFESAALVAAGRVAAVESMAPVGAVRSASLESLRGGSPTLGLRNEVLAGLAAVRPHPFESVAASVVASLHALRIESLSLLGAPRVAGLESSALGSVVRLASVESMLGVGVSRPLRLEALASASVLAVMNLDGFTVVLVYTPAPVSRRGTLHVHPRSSALRAHERSGQLRSHNRRGTLR